MHFAVVLVVLLPALNAGAYYQHRAYTAAQVVQPAHDHATHDHAAYDYTTLQLQKQVIALVLRQVIKQHVVEPRCLVLRHVCGDVRIG